MKKILILMAIAIACLTSCNKEEDTEKIVPPQEDYLSVYYDDIAFPSDGGEDSFRIESNTNWTIMDDADWLTIEPVKGNGYATITMTASASDLYDDRNTVITVKAGDLTKSFTVTQKYAEALLVTKNKFDIPQEGGEFTIELQSNMSYEIQIDPDSQSWITEIPQSKALTAYTHTFSVEANPNTTKRDGSVEIVGNNGKTETVCIYQAEKGEIVLSKSEETVPAKGGEVRVQLRSNVDYEVIVPGDIDWVEQLQSNKADELVFNVKPNDRTENRETEITVKDKNSDLSQIFTIKQIVGSIILEDSYFEVDPKGGTIKVNLSTDIDFDVIIPEEIDWVTQIETKALEKRTFNLNVFPNSLTEEREAEITVKDVNSDVSQDLTIKQKVGQIIVNQNEFEVQFKGGTITIPYTSDIECKVIIPESVQSWISVVETKSMESHSVQLSIALNKDKKERTATISIQDMNSPLSQNIEIRQMALGYYKGDIHANSEVELKIIRESGYTIIDGNVYFSGVRTLTELDNIIEEITGNLTIGYGVTTLDGLYGLKKIGGDLICKENDDLTSFEGLNNLESIGNNLDIKGLSTSISLKPLKKLEMVGGNVILYNIDNFEGPENLSQIGDSLILNKTGCQGFTSIRSLKNLKAISIDSFEGLNNLTTISEDLYCKNCNIKDFSGLNSLQTISGNFTIKAINSFNELTSFMGLNKLSEIGGNFIITGSNAVSNRSLSKLENFKGLENLKIIKGALEITSDEDRYISYKVACDMLGSLYSFEVLSNLTSVGSFIIESYCGPYFLYNLMSLRGLENLIEVHGDFIVNFAEYNKSAIRFSEGPEKLSLVEGNFIVSTQDISAHTTMEGFSGLETVNGSMSIINVYSCLGLDSLKYIKRNLTIASSDTQGMSNLTTIGGNLTVSGYLSSINGLTGLSTVNGNLSIRKTSMTAINGMTQLQKFGGDIEISDNRELEDISGLSGLTNCANVSITNSPNLYNFQPLETAAKNMTGTWYVYGCGYNPTKYQMLNGESKPQE